MGEEKEAAAAVPSAVPSGSASLSIVVITRNTKELLRDLLRSVEADVYLSPLLRDLIVIDNNSTDGTQQMVAKEFPWVVLVKNDRNRGFAAAANRGTSLTRGDYVLFLNSDTVLIEGQAAAMVRFMEENPKVGICGPQLVYEDMSNQRSFAHIPSLLFEIVPRSILERMLPGRYSAIPKKGKVQSGKDLQGSCLASSVVVPSLIGAAIMVRKSLLVDLGGFDEQFFFFLEETDLCVRIAKHGQAVTLLPHVRIIHLQGKTVRKNWIQGRIQYNISLYAFIRKHHRWVYYRLFQGVRLMKSIVVPAFLAAVPIVLFHRRTRRTFLYYLRLLQWHVRGCPDDAGLLVSSRE